MNRIEAFVPLRSGSKGIPQKNIKEFCGKPLFYWVIQELIKVSEIDSIVVSTDDSDIASCVIMFCDLFCQQKGRIKIHARSKESANDINHWEMAIEEYLKTDGSHLSNYDSLVMAQVTSPFTRAKHIREAIELHNRFDGFCSVVTCTRTHRFFWNENGNPINYDQMSRPRRQDFQGTLMENGAFCINSVRDIKGYQNRLSHNVFVYEMKGEHTRVEIDSKDDWYYAEYLFRKYELDERGERL